MSCWASTSAGDEPDSDETSRLSPRLGSWRVLGRLLEIDGAVAYALLLRAWQLPAGLVSMLLVAAFFSGQQQGYYYTFSSLLALQTFFDLGLGVVVLNVASHEWARMNTAGDEAARAQAANRLAGLVRRTVRWYAAAALLFVVLVATVGGLFLAQGKSAGASWQAPWIASAMLAGACLWMMPLKAVLEACGRVEDVHRFRLVQAVCANLAVWTTISLGGGLWAAPAALAVQVVADLRLVWGLGGPLLSPLLRQQRTDYPWKAEIWPLQWRRAVQAVVAWFSLSLFTPVLFHYRGADDAGRMGMTWTLIVVLQSAAAAWVYTRVPRFGFLIARGDRASLDRLFARLSIVSTTFLTLACGACWLGVVILGRVAPSLAERVLPPAPTAIFMAGAVINHIPHCLTLYVRAHKRDPFVIYGLASGLAVGLAVWLLGSRLGAIGAASGYAAVAAVLHLPYASYLWTVCRRDFWKAPA